MDDDTHRQLLERHFAAKVKRDEAALRSQLTDTVRWWVPESAVERGLAPRRVEGIEAVVALLMTTSLYVTDRRHWTIHHLLCDGDAAAVHATFDTETVAGQPYTNHYVFIFEFKDGRIDQVWEHLDTAYLFARLTPG